jgi:rhodanese-related sulfurtransferase
MAEVPEITPAELHERLKSAAPPLVVDVREPWETAICQIEGSRLIPLRSLPQRLQELPRDRGIAVICHTGARSYMAAGFLQQHGYDAVSVQSGIEGWARAVDQKMRRY